jgi:hypothetical protein
MQAALSQEFGKIIMKTAIWRKNENG